MIALIVIVLLALAIGSLLVYDARSTRVFARPIVWSDAYERQFVEDRAQWPPRTMYD